MWKDVVNKGLRSVTGCELNKARPASAGPSGGVPRAPKKRPSGQAGRPGEGPAGAADPRPLRRRRQEDHARGAAADHDRLAEALRARARHPLRRRQRCPRRDRRVRRLAGRQHAGRGARTLLDAELPATATSHLFDTFEGMPPPTEEDRRHDGASAANLLEPRTARSHAVWAVRRARRRPRRHAPRRAIPSRPRPLPPGHGRGHACPTQAPEQIALLRLDTDWYSLDASTSSSTCSARLAPRRRADPRRLRALGRRPPRRPTSSSPTSASRCC